jgi:hypothetical protein
MLSEFESLENAVDAILIQKLQDQLGDIEQGRVDGKFYDDQGQIAPGQAILNQLLRYPWRLTRSDAHDIVSEILIFQEAEESQESIPLSERLCDLIEQARETKEILVHYIAETAQEARRVSLSTIHALKNSLGILILIHISS